MLIICVSIFHFKIPDKYLQDEYSYHADYCKCLERHADIYRVDYFNMLLNNTRIAYKIHYVMTNIVMVGCFREQGQR